MNKKEKGLIKPPSPHEPQSEHAPLKTDMVKELVKLRKGLKLSVADVAKKLQIPDAEVERIETHSKDETFDRIYDYANALGAKFELVLPKK